MSATEIKELKELIEKSTRLTEMVYKIIENEIKMLRYEFSSGILQPKVHTFSMDNYMTEIKCRMCSENKKVVKGGKQDVKKICQDCTNDLIDEYESDNDVC